MLPKEWTIRSLCLILRRYDALFVLLWTFKIITEIYVIHAFYQQQLECPLLFEKWNLEWLISLNLVSSLYNFTNWNERILIELTHELKWINVGQGLFSKGMWINLDRGSKKLNNFKDIAIFWIGSSLSKNCPLGIVIALFCPRKRWKKRRN